MSQWGLNYEMTLTEFRPFEPVLQANPFEISPAPKGFQPHDKWRWIQMADNSTHIIVREENSQKDYYLPLLLIQFANPGVLVLTRPVFPFNGAGVLSLI